MSTGKRIASCFFAALCTLAALPLRAQIANVDDTTSTPTPGVGHDYVQMLSETVDPAHGSVSLRINLPTPKGRGMTLPFSIDYDSGSENHLYSPTFMGILWAPNSGTMLQGGWSYGYPSANFAMSQQTQYTVINTQYSCAIDSNYVFRDPSGGLHPLLLTTSSVIPGSGVAPCNGMVPFGGDSQFGAAFPPRGLVRVLAPLRQLTPSSWARRTEPCTTSAPVVATTA